MAQLQTLSQGADTSREQIKFLKTTFAEKLLKAGRLVTVVSPLRKVRKNRLTAGHYSCVTVSGGGPGIPRSCAANATSSSAGSRKYRPVIS